MRTRAVLLVIAAVAVACGRHVAVLNHARPVPWTDSTPAPEGPAYATPPPGPVPACGARDLDVSVYLGGAAGSLAGGIDLKNVSAHLCTLSGRPAVKILDAGGKVIPVQVSSADPQFEADVKPSRWPSVYLRRGDTATAFVSFSEWCTPRRPARWSVRIPSIDAIFKPLQDATPTCHGETLSASSEPLLAVGPAQPRPLTTAAVVFPFSVAIQAPASVAAGSEVRYSVTLTNTSTEAFRFGRCPVYGETIAGQGIKAAGQYVLNCSPVGSVAPRGSVTFEMVLPYWATSAGGTASLFWGLEGSETASAHVPVVVNGA